MHVRPIAAALVSMALVVGWVAPDHAAAAKRKPDLAIDLFVVPGFVIRKTAADTPRFHVQGRIRNIGKKAAGAYSIRVELWERYTGNVTAPADWEELRAPRLAKGKTWEFDKEFVFLNPPRLIQYDVVLWVDYHEEVVEPDDDADSDNNYMSIPLSVFADSWSGTVHGSWDGSLSGPGISWDEKESWEAEVTFHFTRVQYIQDTPHPSVWGAFYKPVGTAEFSYTLQATVGDHSCASSGAETAFISGGDTDLFVEDVATYFAHSLVPRNMTVSGSCQQQPRQGEDPWFNTDREAEERPVAAETLIGSHVSTSSGEGEASEYSWSWELTAD